ncbi:MAG: DinB family protein [Desulfovibrionaceae bacterium]
MQISPQSLNVPQELWKLLRKTPSDATSVRIGPDAWTLKEIVGHLVDSASNNHQRFVRLGAGDLRDFPGYDPEVWVAQQKYDGLPWETLLHLWKSYNELLVHLIAFLPEEAGKNVWHSPDGPLSLEFLVEDYYRHMRLHIEHFARRCDEIGIC